MTMKSEFALTILSATASPNLVKKFHFSREGWMGFQSWVGYRGGRKVAADSGFYLMVDVPKLYPSNAVEGRWQRAMIQYHPMLDYVDIARLTQALILLRTYRADGSPRTCQEFELESGEKAIWNNAQFGLDVSSGPEYRIPYEGSLPIHENLSVRYRVLLSPEFLLSENKGVLVMPYPPKEGDGLVSTSSVS